MRAIAAIGLLALAACSSAPTGGGAYSSTSAQLKPETVAGCNAETLSIDLAGGGMISVNGQPTTMDALKAAAAKKDAACQSAPAMVLYAYAATAPADIRDGIKQMLKQTIVHLTLVEMSKG